MERTAIFSPATIAKDLMAGVIVFLVALPLCLGIALASGAPLFSGIVAGIIGGILVGILSGSHSSVTGPAAGLTAIVAAQIANLGSFEAFLLAVVIGGMIQIGLGLIKAGALSAFFPSSVINGLLAAIGLILILKQIPYLLGYDMTPKGDSHGHPNIFSEIGKLFTGEIHPGALAIGLTSLTFLMLWDKIAFLKKSLFPAPLVVVLAAMALTMLLGSLGSPWVLSDSKRLMVSVPVANSLSQLLSFLKSPDFSQIVNPAVYIAGVTIAVVASLETLLNLDAVDKLDKKQRLSPPSRELLAQGIGNVTSGLLGGLPVTAVVVRGSVNINAGAQTKLSAIFHGLLLLVCVAFLPTYLNMIPLSSLAAILLMTGFKLASGKLFRQMWAEGPNQFLPFIITLTAIVATDLLIGIVIGLGVSIAFILNSNLRRPIRRVVEKHVGGEVLHIELPNQVSFLNRAALEKALRDAPRGTHILLDARRTHYIDPDILHLIREFKDVTAPVYDVQVSLRGFRDKYALHDDIQFVDYTTRELQDQLTPQRVLQLLKEGNERFFGGQRLDRSLGLQSRSRVVKQHPMAVVFSGINSLSPPEMIFDLGLGDVYSIRLAGAVTGHNVIGSMEYACHVKGARLIVVLGHTGSTLVTHAIENALTPRSPSGGEDAGGLTDCPHLEPVLQAIQESIDLSMCPNVQDKSPDRMAAFADLVSRRNVIRSVRHVVEESESIRRLVDTGHVAVVGAMYDVATGQVEFLLDDAIGLANEAGAAIPLSRPAPHPLPRGERAG